MSEIADAVTGTIGDLFGDQTEDAVQPEAEQAAVQETEVAETVELPDWEAASRDLFTEDDDDEPDFTAVADDDIDVTDELAPSEYDDENTANLKRQLLTERKRTEHFRNQHLKSSRKQWEADVKSQPWGEFVELGQVKGSSHREFKRNAKAIAKANYTLLKPHLDKLQAAKTQLVSQAKAEAETEVRAAWGNPTVGGAQVPASTDQKLGDSLQEARRSRSMFRATKALIDGDAI